jgi:hypothetical protein
MQNLSNPTYKATAANKGRLKKIAWFLQLLHPG